MVRRSSPVLATAVAFSRTHASSVDPGGPGGYRASFLLDRDPQAYGRAEQLIRMTFGWKATHAEVGGRPVRIRTIQLMLDCARGELEETGSCRRAMRLDILHANQLGSALFSEIFRDPVRPPNAARFVFLDPRATEFYIEWESIAHWDMGENDPGRGLRAMRKGSPRWIVWADAHDPTPSS